MAQLIAQRKHHLHHIKSPSNIITTNSWMMFFQFCKMGSKCFVEKFLGWRSFWTIAFTFFQLLTKLKKVDMTNIFEDAASGLEQPSPGLSEKWVKKRKCRWLCSCLRAPHHESQYQLEPPYRNWLRHWSWKLLDSTSWNILSF